MKNRIYILGVMLTIALAQIMPVDAIYEYNFTSAPAYKGINAQAYFQVEVLKYDPYPVNPGDWFDVWIKIENLGQDDAKNVRFELRPQYPFVASDDAIKDYGTFYGIESAYISGEQKNANVAILKYRVKLADNAPSGVSNLKFAAITNYLYADMETNTITSLPITVGKTKTDFDVVLQDASAQGISFTMANTGQNPASAVTVSLDSKGLINSSGSTSMIVGSISSGDFTTVTFSGFPARTNELSLNISYTDIAGIRNTINKIVSLGARADGNFSGAVGGFGATGNGARRTGAAGATAITTTASNSRYTYLAGGFIFGVLITLFFKRKSKKQQE